MKYCANCGNEINDNVFICIKCGYQNGQREVKKEKNRDVSSTFVKIISIFNIIFSFNIFIVFFVSFLSHLLFIQEVTEMGYVVSDHSLLIFSIILFSVFLIKGIFGIILTVRYWKNINLNKKQSVLFKIIYTVIVGSVCGAILFAVE